MGGWVNVKVIKSQELLIRFLELYVSRDVDFLQVWPKFEFFNLGHFLCKSCGVVLNREGELVAEGMELPVHGSCEQGHGVAPRLGSKNGISELLLEGFGREYGF